MSYRESPNQGPTNQSVAELMQMVEEYEGSEYALDASEPNSHVSVLCSCVKLIADLTARVDDLEGRGQRASEYASARVGK